MSKSPKEIFALLSTMTVELPPESEEKKKEYEEINRSIAGMGRVFRGGTDWAYREYKEKEPIRFQSGDLVKVFKTVSDGDIHWQGTVDFDYTNYHHGLQKDMEPRDWSSMFMENLPARLERDGEVLYGALEPFSETGTEGVIWSLKIYGLPGYAGLKPLKQGDQLTVFENVRDGEVDWEGELEFGPEEISKLGWTEILRKSMHLDTEEWMNLCWEARPVIVTPRLDK